MSNDQNLVPNNLVRACRSVIAILVCLLLVAGDVAAQLPKGVREALERNAKSLSPISVTWTEQLASDYSLQEWCEKINVEPIYVDFFIPVKKTYAWQDGMSYSHDRDNKADITLLVKIDEDGQLHARPGADFENIKRMLCDREAACNLEKVFLGEGRDTSTKNKVGPTILIDRLGELRIFRPETKLFGPTYLQEVGFRLPNRVSEQGVAAQSLLLALIEDGARVARSYDSTLDSRPCVVVELEEETATTRFFLSPSRGHAVVRREYLAPSGQTFSVAEMSDIVQLHDSDLWLPRRCEIAYYGWETIPGVLAEEPIAKKTFVVSEIDKRRMPLDRFILDYRIPFTSVADSTLPQANQTPKGIVRYEVPLNYVDLDSAIQKSIDKRRKWGSVVDGSQQQEKPFAIPSPKRGRLKLTRDQQRLVGALSNQVSSYNETSPQVRVAIFNMELKGYSRSGGLEKILARDPLCSWMPVNETDIQSGALDDFDVVVFPGGNSGHQSALLGDDGKEAVRSFVRKGGGYIGICAGAFLANAEREGDLAILDAKTLRGRFEVPGLPWKMSFSARSGSVRAELTDAGGKVFGDIPRMFDAFFSGGPIFSHEQNNDFSAFIPLAMYRTEVWKVEAQKGTMINTPAIIAGSFGKGRVIAFGFHPETKGTNDTLIRKAILSVSQRSANAKR